VKKTKNCNWTVADFTAQSRLLPGLDDKDADLALVHFAAAPCFEWVMCSPRIIRIFVEKQ